MARRLEQGLGVFLVALALGAVAFTTAEELREIVGA